MKRPRTINLKLSSFLPPTNIICTIVLLMLLSNVLGVFSPDVLHLAAVSLTIGFCLLNIPLARTFHGLKVSTGQRSVVLIGILLALGSLLVLLLSTTTFLWICSIPVLLSGVDLIVHKTQGSRPELPVLIAASLGYTLVYILLNTIPAAWYLIQQSSLLVSHSIGVVRSTPLLLGPSASGLWIVLVFLIVLLSWFLCSPHKTKAQGKTLLLCIIGLILLWIIYLLFLSTLTVESNQDAVGFHPVFCVLCFIPFFAYIYRHGVPETPVFHQRGFHGKNVLKHTAIWAAVLLFFSTSLLTLTLPMTPQQDQPRVLFYADHMLGTWDVPEYGKYGKEGVGMFGLWPVYLSAMGYDTRILVHNTSDFLNTAQPSHPNITRFVNLTDYLTIVESPSMTTDLLSQIDILVVTNLNTTLSQQEHDCIWEYVHSGGSLLVLGDHTNVGDIQAPLNTLLRPVEISFRFDAALPLDERHRWITCNQLLHHPVTIPITSTHHLQYGVGASLNITSAASPLIVGTYALSDAGDAASQDLAYLGDYSYEPGEHLGDLILVAAAYYGEGKVLVFGDTSSFQNTALPFSSEVLQSTFLWLASGHTQTATALQLGVAILLLIGAAIFVTLLKKQTMPFAVYPVIVCTALLLTSSINPLLCPQPSFSGNLVSIDTSHGERVSQDSFTDTSVNGLILNLQRNNYQPMLIDRFDRDVITASHLLVCIAPTQPFSSDDVTFLNEYMEHGGVVLLATGYEDSEASAPLLDAFNIEVESTPLGPVPYVEGNTTAYQHEPRFVDSWPLSFQDPSVTSYYNFTWGEYVYHLVIFVEHGAGGLLVISDSQFLLDKNIESIYDYWPGNILFLRYLITELQAREGHR